MTGRASQNTRTRDPRATRERRRPTLLSLLTGGALLAALGMAVTWFPASELDRAIDANLTRLANSESWIR